MFAASEDFQTTTVTVATRTGTGANGDVYATAVPRDVFLEDSRRLVRSATGEQVISESTVFDDPDQGALYTPDSKVTLPTRVARVILAKANVIGDTDVDHLEVVLT